MYDAFKETVCFTELQPSLSSLTRATIEGRKMSRVETEKKEGSKTRSRNLLPYSKRAQIGFMALSIYALAVVGMYEIGNTPGSFNGENIRAFFPKVEAPVSLLLSLLSFLAALSIAIAAASRDIKKEITRLANFSYIASIISSVFVTLLIPSLFDHLVKSQAILVTVCAFIALYFLGRFSITASDYEIERAQIDSYKASETAAQNRAEHFRNSMTPGKRGESIVPIMIAALVGILPYGMVVGFLAHVSGDNLPAIMACAIMSLLCYAATVAACITDVPGTTNVVSAAIFITVLMTMPIALMIVANYAIAPPAMRISNWCFIIATVFLVLTVAILFVNAAIASNSTYDQCPRWRRVFGILINSISTKLKDAAEKQAKKFAEKASKKGKSTQRK